MPPGPLRPRRRRLLLGAGALLLALLLAECGARAAASMLQRGRGVDFDPVLGWSMLPHVEKRGEFWSASEPGRTNSHGWRDKERTLHKPPGVRRLAALGDSFTFGQGVDAAMRFTELVEEATGWEVLNFGACGYGTDQELLVYEHVARRFAPDAVLLTVFLGNDLDDIRLERQSGWGKPWFRLHGDALQLVAPEPSWATGLRRRSYLAEMALQALERNVPAARRAPEWRDADTAPLFVALVRRLVEAARQDGAHLLVLFAQPCDGTQRVRRHERTAELSAALQAIGVDCIDSHDAFAAAAGERLFLTNGHWSAAGHALVARLLVDAMRQQPWFGQ